MRINLPSSFLLFLLLLPATLALTACSTNVVDNSLPVTSNPTKITPVITWPQPAPITNPAPLTTTQLDAMANVAGTFVYSPSAGTVLAPGNQTLTTTFAPDDATDYDTATASVTLVVNPAVNSQTCQPPGSGPVSGSEHLAVADTDNGRVLIFDAPFTTGECASVVLGQANFDSYVWQGESANLMYGPIGLAVDAVGNLWVADYNDGRIVQFQPPFENGMNASLELGVPSFSSPGDDNDTNCYNNPPAMSLCMPAGVTLDSSGNLWVADMWDGRVVEYQPPITQAMDATLAIGQPSLDETADCDGTYTNARGSAGAPVTTTASEFCHPFSTAFDGSGDLWIADTANHRVLEFVPPFSTGMAASLELGFPAGVGMNSPTPPSDGWTCPAGAYLCGPAGLAFDSSGNLWVADSVDNRVLEFVPPFSSGMAASLAIGQPNLTQSSAPSLPSANTLSNPQGVAFDSNGDLIVTESSNNRVTIFVPPFTTGMSASAVLGQPDMNSATGHGCETAISGQPDDPGASGFCHPTGVLTF